MPASVLRRRVIANRNRACSSAPPAAFNSTSSNIQSPSTATKLAGATTATTARAGALVVSRRHTRRAAAKSARASMIATSASAPLAAPGSSSGARCTDCANDSSSGRADSRSASSVRSRTSKRYLQTS